MQRFPINRPAVIAGASFFAIFLFGVGLISPLTPSEGMPTLVDVVVFVGVPIVLLLGAALLARDILARIALLLLAVALLT